MRWTIIIGIIGSLFMGDSLWAQEDLERRKQYLDEVLQINIDQLFRENTRRVSVQDSVWMDWLQRSGELPPDFSKMRSTPMLPEPLVFYDGTEERPITTAEQWQKKRDWIKEQYQYWVSGHFPPAPENVRATILSDTVTRGVRIQMIQLHFGPEHKAKMTLELMIPEGNTEDGRP